MLKETDMRITFLGAAGTVTGSKYLLEQGNRHVLVDCGLFQGYKQLRLHNRIRSSCQSATWMPLC